MTLAEVAAILRKHGWTVIPPQTETPAPDVGQVWVSPKARTASRTVLGFSACERYGDCVVYSQDDGCLTSRITLKAWDAWVRTAKAWPA